MSTAVEPAQFKLERLRNRKGVRLIEGTELDRSKKDPDASARSVMNGVRSNELREMWQETSNLLQGRCLSILSTC